uniref:Uncharacterized protein n=1 Tax=Aegilops tauschii subsp. strangulata TaxID=200361 RepID=A0A453C729_AEGTS
VLPFQISLTLLVVYLFVLFLLFSIIPNTEVHIQFSSNVFVGVGKRPFACPKKRNRGAVRRN